MKSTRFKTVILALALCLGFAANAQDAEAAPALTEEQVAGEGIFKAACASCHYFSKDNTGPKLGGVVKRQGKKWLTEWIDNPAKVVASGDKHANEMVAKYGQIMPTIGLSAEEIVQVIAYLEVGQDDPETPVKGKVEGPTTPQQGGSDNTAPVLIVVLVVLVLIILLLILLSSVVTKSLKVKEEKGELSDNDKEFVNQKHSIISLIKHPAFLGGAVAIALLGGALFFVTEILYGIGVQQGYQPTQPIAFSHKLHAGNVEDGGKGIDCNYCHTGVRKAKHANIPAASICMNCHNKIKTESLQIQQIHKAIDYDVKTNTYGDNTRPIKWVRIHNLPDHVYFNHAQHVNVAGLECENCHGPIKEMEKVYQYSPLTMGWCIDCHRETKVSHALDNDYYDNLIEAHEGDPSEMTVESIGGLECGRCHY